MALTYYSAQVYVGSYPYLGPSQPARVRCPRCHGAGWVTVTRITAQAYYRKDETCPRCGGKRTVTQ